jgi:predicted transcriptional regulator of viral defense system
MYYQIIINNNDIMVTYNTILSQKDEKLLEDTIISYGRIVDSSQLKKIFCKEYSQEGANNRISLLSKKGWLLRIRKGLFVVVTDFSNLGFNDLSIYLIAKALNKNSYISFENALQYHEMFDQMLSAVESVTFERVRKYKFQNTNINFLKIKKELFFGFSGERINSDYVNIAGIEKAILDMLYFRKDSHNISLVWEKLNEYRKNFDFQKLQEYAAKLNDTIIRQTGFLLDFLKVDTQDLYRIIKGKKSYSIMVNDYNKFNSKWRLYYDSKSIE